MIEHTFPHQQGLYSPNRERKYLNADERARFLRAAENSAPMVRTLCETLVFSGCRITEALTLPRSAILLDEQVIVFRSLKKRGQLMMREVPMPGNVINRLALVHQLYGLNAETAGERIWGWHRSQAWRLVKRVMTDAGIAGLQACPRGLRHGFGIHAIRSGVPLTLVQRWLGHSQLSTTGIYLNAVGPDERKLAARMWNV